MSKPQDKMGEESLRNNEAGKGKDGFQGKITMPGNKRGLQFWNSLFNADQCLWIKIAGAGVATGLFMGGAIFRRQKEMGEVNITTVVVFGALSMIPGMILGAALSMYDHVKKRIAQGESVPFFIKLYFGMGGVSLLVGLFTVAFLVIGSIFLYDMCNGLNWK